MKIDFSGHLLKIYTQLKAYFMKTISQMFLAVLSIPHNVKSQKFSSRKNSQVIHEVRALNWWCLKCKPVRLFIGK
jgi:hypothetical protein